MYHSTYEHMLVAITHLYSSQSSNKFSHGVSLLENFDEFCRRVFSERFFLFSTTLFFYKNKVYKNKRLQEAPKLRTC